MVHPADGRNVGPSVRRPQGHRLVSGVLHRSPKSETQYLHRFGSFFTLFRYLAL
jgi:hypothetical protein